MKCSFYHRLSADKTHPSESLTDRRSTPEANAHKSPTSGPPAHIHFARTTHVSPRALHAVSGKVQNEPSMPPTPLELKSRQLHHLRHTAPSSRRRLRGSPDHPDKLRYACRRLSPAAPSAHSRPPRSIWAPLSKTPPAAPPASPPPAAAPHRSSRVQPRI